jgi:hypothetical protein
VAIRPVYRTFPVYRGLGFGVTDSGYAGSCSSLATCHSSLFLGHTINPRAMPCGGNTEPNGRARAGAKSRGPLKAALRSLKKSYDATATTAVAIPTTCC